MDSSYLQINSWRSTSVHLIRYAACVRHKLWELDENTPSCYSLSILHPVVSTPSLSSKNRDYSSKVMTGINAPQITNFFLLGFAVEFLSSFQYSNLQIFRNSFEKKSHSYWMKNDTLHPFRSTALLFSSLWRILFFYPDLTLKIIIFTLL